MLKLPVEPRLTEWGMPNGTEPSGVHPHVEGAPLSIWLGFEPPHRASRRTRLYDSTSFRNGARYDGTWTERLYLVRRECGGEASNQPSQQQQSAVHAVQLESQTHPPVQEQQFTRSQPQEVDSRALQRNSPSQPRHLLRLPGGLAIWVSVWLYFGLQRRIDEHMRNLSVQKPGAASVAPASTLVSLDSQQAMAVHRGWQSLISLQHRRKEGTVPWSRTYMGESARTVCTTCVRASVASACHNTSH